MPTRSNFKEIMARVYADTSQGQAALHLRNYAYAIHYYRAAEKRIPKTGNTPKETNAYAVERGRIARILRTIRPGGHAFPKKNPSACKYYVSLDGTPAEAKFNSPPRVGEIIQTGHRVFRVTGMSFDQRHSAYTVFLKEVPKGFR